MKQRINIAVHQGDHAKASALAGALGAAKGDHAGTFTSASNEDIAGRLYYLASLKVGAAWFAGATQALSRPPWDTEGEVDMALASQGQAMLDVWDGAGTAPQARPGAIVVIPGVAPPTARALMGLRQVVEDV